MSSVELFERFKPDPAYLQPDAPRVVIIDHELTMDLLVLLMATYGIDMHGINVNTQSDEWFDARAASGDGELTKLLQKPLVDFALASNPLMVIVDKNLGIRHGGLGTVQGLQEQSDVLTALLTGEPETRESHRIADFYLQKPIEPENLASFIKEKLGIT